MKLGPLQQEWVDKLRSGDYNQGQHKLRTVNNEYCCLGILEDTHNNSKECTETHYEYFDTEHQECYYGTLCSQTRELIKIKPCQVMILADMNDRGRSFDEIANYIEENAEVIFSEPV